jgi:hypothetical protein
VVVVVVVVVVVDAWGSVFRAGDERGTSSEPPPNCVVWLRAQCPAPKRSCLLVDDDEMRLSSSAKVASNPKIGICIFSFVFVSPKGSYPAVPP